ncbi:MAG: sterol desaturase family protein [Elusimicrobia bacterium]|nr:sterol desaturase family protein [Elusimicrobiota bacterium]
MPFFPGRRGRLRHGLRNLGLSLINAAVLAAPSAGATAAVIAAAGELGLGLTDFIPGDRWPAIAAFVLFDCWMYLWHRANHRYRLLWRFHRAHHSDTDVDATTALRFHPGEIAMSTAARLPIYLLLGREAVVVPGYEAVLLAVTLFHHSNIVLPSGLDRFLRVLIVTPGMHRIHHSDLRVETDSNYSSVFSFWDRLFGSFRFRGDGPLVMGLETYRAERWQTLAGMFLTPFRDDGPVTTSGVYPQGEGRETPR